MNVTDYEPLIGGATFSACGQYRYHLWRRIERPRLLEGPAERGTVLFIMLNPSTADAANNDPTVERCCVRAGMLGFSRLEVCNLFALRSTDPKALYRHPDPVGPENDSEILKAALGAGLVICAWGTHGTQLGKHSHHVKDMLTRSGVKLHALKIAKGGEPCHPLYLPYALQPVPMP